MPLQGRIDPRGHARVWIWLRGPLASADVEALVDTGFTGALGISDGYAARLGLLRRGSRVMATADGRVQTVPVYLVDADWISGTVPCEALAVPSDVTLIGAGLLRGHVLVIDYGPGQSVEIR